MTLRQPCCATAAPPKRTAFMQATEVAIRPHSYQLFHNTDITALGSLHYKTDSLDIYLKRMAQKTLPLPLPHYLTPTHDDDPFEVLRLSLQRWPLFYQLNTRLMASTNDFDDPEDALPPVCVACGDSSTPSTPLLTLRCACSFCGPCLQTLFTRALSDESLYPPSCHRRPIPLSKATRHHLPASLVRAHRQKTIEFTTKNKIYCAKVPECNAFVAPQSVHNAKAYCQKCGTVTCVRCKEIEHWGPCVSGEGTLLGVLEMGEKEKWRSCPGCKRLVEKIDGCNHILCRCKTDFCYACGLQVDYCECVEGDEDETEGEDYDLEEDLERIMLVHREVQRRARTPEIREVEEDIIADTMIAPFELAEDELADW